MSATILRLAEPPHLSTPLRHDEPAPAPLPLRGLPLDIAGLRKDFGSKTVLQGLDLSIRAGEFVAVIGKSGCGKSTLLRLVAGLDRPTAGQIRLGGHPLTGINRQARVMFQEARLLPWRNVLQNVLVGLGPDHDGDRRQAALAALAEVGLADRAGEWPAVLSGGQRQRVALARALVSRPALLVLDEPLGALDALTRINMQALIERIWLHEGFTTLLVTHDVSEALALADRVILIENGAISYTVQIDLPRPRRRGSTELGLLEEDILNRLFKEHEQDGSGI
jgi:sulfonate transport system ATP-binding protein